MPKTPEYGSSDGYATRFVDDEAWVLVNGTWREMNPADAVFEAALLSEERYHRAFGSVPPLPSTAFTSDPWRGQRRTSDQRMLMLLDAKQGGGHAQHMIARRTAPNGPEPDPARYAAALARAREIYGRVWDSYSPEWKAVFGKDDTGISGVGSDSGPDARPATAGARMPGKPKVSGGWSSPLV